MVSDDLIFARIDLVYNELPMQHIGDPPVIKLYKSNLKNDAILFHGELNQRQIYNFLKRNLNIEKEVEFE